MLILMNIISAHGVQIERRAELKKYPKRRQFWVTPISATFSLKNKETGRGKTKFEFLSTN